MPYVKNAELDRLRAAEEVCFALTIMASLGGLELPKGQRDYIGEPLLTWANKAVATGVLEA